MYEKRNYPIKYCITEVFKRPYIAIHALEQCSGKIVCEVLVRMVMNIVEYVGIDFFCYLDL